MGETKKIEDGQVVSMDYSLSVDGELLEGSQAGQPLEYLHGAGSIIPGLERQLDGLALGESKQVVVSAADGYGQRDAEAVMDVPRGEFPAGIPLQVGTELQVQDKDGGPLYARIAEVGAETVRLDFNHPLAGKELHFEVKIVGLRPATPEELDHGHAHPAGHSH
jgi:FKBP-type peptidyl-prolyl cis-trans isomerase SlyD